jgi:antitoxin component of MazEF toxin-antitoxin module
MDKRRVMTKKLARIGNSSALLIDKPIMELLGIRPDDTVSLVTDGISLIVTPTFRRPTKKESEAAFDKVVRRHGEALRALGDTSALSTRSQKRSSGSTGS